MTMLRYIASWWLVPIVAMIGYIAYAFTVPPPWAVRRATGELTQRFTTAGRAQFNDLELSFSYPTGWTVGESVSRDFDVHVGVTPAGTKATDAAGEIAITSVSRSAALLSAPKPLLPRGATVYRNDEGLFGTTLAHVVEYSWVSPDKKYRRCLSMESTDQKRCVELLCSAFGPAEDAAAVDGRFEENRATFEAILASLKFSKR